MTLTKKKIKILSLVVLIVISIGIYCNFSDNLTNINEKTEVNKENNDSEETLFKIEEENHDLKTPKVSDSWGPGEVPFIHIRKDNWTENIFDWIIDGAGTLNDPHIIENVTIDATGFTSGYCGIGIEDSIDHFIIKNCTVYGTIGDLSAGIGLRNVTNSQLINNKVYNNAYGIGLIDCDDNTISGNTANNNAQSGIWIYGSNSNTISGNTANNNAQSGIKIEDSNSNTISENTANSNGQSGIELLNSGSNTISLNTANVNNAFGIDLTNSHLNTLLSNYVHDNDDEGIILEESDDNTISENDIKDNGESGIGLEDSDNNEISENDIKNNDNKGIDLEGSNDNEILENEVNGNGEWGIFLEESDDNEVKKNDLRDNNDGCVTEINCDGNVIEDNICGDDIDLTTVYTVIIIFIIIFFICVVSFIVLGSKNTKKELNNIVDKSAEKQIISDERLEKLKNILDVSNKIKLERVKNILNLDDKSFDAKIIEWANEFGFIIDGEYLVVNKDSLSEFTDALDKKFTEWEQMEKVKDGKSVISSAVIVENVNEKVSKSEELEEIKTQLETKFPEIKNLVQKKDFSKAIDELEKVKEGKSVISSAAVIVENVNEKLPKSQELETIKTELENKFPTIRNLIKSKEFSNSIEELENVRSVAKEHKFVEIVSWTEKKLDLCNHLIIKEVVLEIGSKSGRLQATEISEKCRIKDEKLITNVIKTMIENKEINAEYFPKSKSFVFIQELEKIRSELEAKFPAIENLIQAKKFSKAIEELKNVRSIAKQHKFVEIISWADKILVYSADLKKNTTKDIQKRLREVKELIRERQLSAAIKELNVIVKDAQFQNLDGIVRQAGKKLLRCQELEVIKTDLERNVSTIENQIKSKQFSEASTELRNVRSIAKKHKFVKILGWAELNLDLCKNLLIKKTVLELGAKFDRIQPTEIGEKCLIKDEKLIIRLIQEMIENKEIYAEYFSSSKSLLFNQAANVEVIDKLMEVYKEWEEEKEGKKI